MDSNWAEAERNKLEWNEVKREEKNPLSYQGFETPKDRNEQKGKKGDQTELKRKGIRNQTWELFRTESNRAEKNRNESEW